MKFENIFINLELQCLDATTRIPLPEVNLGERTIFCSKPGDPMTVQILSLGIMQKNAIVKQAMRAGQEFHVCIKAGGSCFDMQPPGRVDAKCFVGEAH